MYGRFIFGKKAIYSIKTLIQSSPNSPMNTTSFWNFLFCCAESDKQPSTETTFGLEESKQERFQEAQDQQTLVSKRGKIRQLSHGSVKLLGQEDPADKQKEDYLNSINQVLIKSREIPSMRDVGRSGNDDQSGMLNGQESKLDGPDPSPIVQTVKNAHPLSNRANNNELQSLKDSTVPQQGKKYNC